MSTKNQPRICIIGGGAGGLSVGYFLKQQGYRNVILLEREDRVGGKCLSITVAGRSFDLGANYITSAYREVKRLARIFGASMYTEGKLNAYDWKEDKFESLFKAVTSQSSFLKLGVSVIRYMFKRWRLSGLISPRNPGYANVSMHPEICQPFDQWLRENNLTELEVLFKIPITLMGYGKLSEIPAAYALTYMSNATFLNLVLAAVSPSLLGYPKRFTEGYQRLWERISWELDVKVGAEVKEVSRKDKIAITYTVREESVGGLMHSHRQLECDQLIIATPLHYDCVSAFLTDMNNEERELLRKVRYDPFIVTTYTTQGLEKYSAATFILPQPDYYEPTVITRQFSENDLISIYTRTPFGETVDKGKILHNNKEFIRKACGVELPDYFTYSAFPYFPHVTSAEMAGNFYGRLEALQGKNRTFFVGGLMNFELVETIVSYSRSLVNNHFPKI